MAVIQDAVEIEDYVPANPSNAVVIDDRWIICVHQTADEFMVFDAKNRTSKAYSGIGTGSGVRTIASAFGYAWVLSNGPVTALCRMGIDGSVISYYIGPGTFWSNYRSYVDTTSEGLVILGAGTAAGTAAFQNVLFNVEEEEVINVSGLKINTNAIVYDDVIYSGLVRVDAITGIKLSDSPSSVPSAELKMPGNTPGGKYGANSYSYSFIKIDPVTTSVSMSINPIQPNTIPAFGPYNLIYSSVSNAPNTKCIVFNSGLTSYKVVDFPTPRTNRKAIAYAQGKMWAFAGEDPNA